MTPSPTAHATALAEGARFLLPIILPLAAYLIGSTPFGVILARFHGVDLRKRGSGNVGATNAGRVLGRRWGFLCFFLDVAKGLVPVLVACRMIWGALPPSPAQQGMVLAVAFGAVAGHVFSIYLKFHGGKGVATSLGVVLGIFPYYTYAALGALAVWITVTLISKYVSLGSIVAAGAFTVLFWALNYSLACELWPLGAFATVMPCLIVARHSSNITRLLAGRENRIGQRAKESGP